MAYGLPGWVDANGIIHWQKEPAGLSRLTMEKKDRTSRLKCLGNAVVPQQAYPIFRGIMEELRRENEHTLCLPAQDEGNA